MNNDDDHPRDWSCLPQVAINAITRHLSDSDLVLLRSAIPEWVIHYRDWSCLSRLAINATVDQLNTIEHMRFRSVCSEWRRCTKERQRAPLLILVDLNRDDTIKSMSFFDIIRKEIISYPFLDRFLFKDFYYLGSSYGWLFTGGLRIHFPPGTGYHYQNQKKRQAFKIRLINPFANQDIPLPVLYPPPRGRGRVFLLGQPADDYENDHFTVIYYVTRDNCADVHYIRVGNHHQNYWMTFSLAWRPCDVIAVKGHLYANYAGVLSEIILETGKVEIDVEFLLPGLHMFLSRDSAFFLRSFENRNGQLHIFFTSMFEENLYGFMEVGVVPKGELAIDFFHPPYLRMGFVDHVLITDTLSVKPPVGYPWVIVHDFSPFRLFIRYAKFWCGGNNQWEPVGWITPVLNPDAV